MGFPTSNAFQPTFGGDTDVFITKVDPKGALIYSSYLGGTGLDESSSLTVDILGNAYITGYTQSPNGTFPTLNAFQPTLGLFQSAFITKVDLTGMLV